MLKNEAWVLFCHQGTKDGNNILVERRGGTKRLEEKGRCVL